jgi:hypothetical protein
MLSQLRNQLGNETPILVGIPKLLLNIQVKRWNAAIKQIVQKKSI